MLSKLKRHAKAILIIEIVIVYFFTLAIILLKHSNDDADTSGYENILFKGESYKNGVTVGDGSISFDGRTDTVREYSEVIDLRNVYAVDVSFSYEYPAQTRDTGIVVDLFSADYGYDRDSQQFVATMTSGTGNVIQRIVLDNDHPDNASVRFTYVDNDVNFKISDVKVSVIRAATQDTVFVLYVIDGILAAITAVTALFGLFARRKREA